MLSPIKLKVPKIYKIDTNKKYLTNSPNSKDSNYTSYTKEQSLTNYIKNKNSNHINSIIINNKHYNMNKTSIFNQNNIISDIKYNSLFFNSISKLNKTKIDKKKNILLSSLFNLPHINSPKNKKSKTNSKYKNHYRKIKLYDSIYKNNFGKKKNTEEYVNKGGIKLENYMKDRFYEDINKKMNIKLKSKVFSHDTSIKDKIINMNKIGLFWGGVFEYCNPLISTKKFKFAKIQNHRKRVISDNDIYIDEYNSKTNKEIKQVLYTNTLFNKLMRNEKIKKDLLFNKRNLILNK